MIIRSCTRHLNGVVRFGPDSSKRSYSIAIAARKSRQRVFQHCDRNNHYNTHLNVTYNSQRTFISSWFSQSKATSDPLTKEPILADTAQATQASSIPLSPSPQTLSSTPQLPTSTPISSASSSSSPLSSPPSSTPHILPPTPSSTSNTSLDELINPEQLENLDVGRVVEEIGFLKNLGLDFGWGPTAFIQWLLEHIHIYTGAPWWASIIITAFIIRASLIKMFFKSADVAARQRALMPVLEPLQERVKAAKASGDRDGISQASQEIKQVFRTAGFNPLSVLLPGMVQGVLGYGTFRLLRNMSTLPVPGLRDGGIAWFQDLTLRDPYFVLPVVATVGMHILFRIGGDTGNHSLQTRFRGLMLYGFPAMGFVFMIWQPSALQISFAAASVLALVQSRLLKNATLREWLGITPLYEMESSSAAAVSATQKPIKGNKSAATITVKKKNNPSSVKNVIATPQYQPPTTNRLGLKGRDRQDAIASDATVTAATASVAAGRAYSSSHIQPENPENPEGDEGREKGRETWLFRTVIAAKESVGDSIRSVKRTIGLGGGRLTPESEAENTTSNPVKTRAYLRDADVYEAERQQYFRDWRARENEKERERMKKKEKKRLGSGNSSGNGNGNGNLKGKSEMWM